MYESWPSVVIITLGNKLYRILEVALPTAISLVTTKKCSKLISKIGKFVFLMICPQGKKKTVATTSRQGPSAWKLQMDKVMEEYEDIFTSPQGFLCTVRSSTPSIWPQVHCCLMDQSIDALFWRTMKSRGRFRICYRKVTSIQVQHPVGTWLCWYRKRMGLGDSVLTIRC